VGCREKGDDTFRDEGSNHLKSAEAVGIQSPGVVALAYLAEFSYPNQFSHIFTAKPGIAECGGREDRPLCLYQFLKFLYSGIGHIITPKTYVLKNISIQYVLYSVVSEYVKD
jgi:hypothetical protein